MEIISSSYMVIVCLAVTWVVGVYFHVSVTAIADNSWNTTSSPISYKVHQSPKELFEERK